MLHPGDSGADAPTYSNKTSQSCSSHTTQTAWWGPPQGQTPSSCLWQLLLHKGSTLTNPEAFSHGLLGEKCFLVISTIDVISILHVSSSSREKTDPQNYVSLLPPASDSWEDAEFGLGAAERRGSHTEAASEGDFRWELSWHKFGNVWSTVKRKSDAQSPQGIFVNQL